MAHGGVAFRQGGLVATGIEKTIVVPFWPTTFGYALDPKLIVLALSRNPVPVMVTRVPTGPALGCRVTIVGADEGETLPPESHAARTAALTHIPRKAPRPHHVIIEDRSSIIQPGAADLRAAYL
jgi:hypothetical protein